MAGTACLAAWSLAQFASEPRELARGDLVATLGATAEPLCGLLAMSLALEKKREIPHGRGIAAFGPPA
jgi:hypothetical protein